MECGGFRSASSRGESPMVASKIFFGPIGQNISSWNIPFNAPPTLAFYQTWFLVPIHYQVYRLQVSIPMMDSSALVHWGFFSRSIFLTNAFDPETQEHKGHRLLLMVCLPHVCGMRGPELAMVPRLARSSSLVIPMPVSCAEIMEQLTLSEPLRYVGPIQKLGKVDPAG